MFQKALFLTTLFAPCFAAVHAQDSLACNKFVKGRVMDADTRQPLANAQLLVQGRRQMVTTNAAGEYLLGPFCAGHYDLLIQHPHCQPQTQHFHLQQADTLALQISLAHAQSSLENVTVSALQSRNTGISSELKGQALAATRGSSLGESLQGIAGVTVLQTGANIYKPVINGLHSNRVLILNNGIRQEGQQWGSEHAPEIDPFIASRLVVVRGASSLQYGGDAIGGVVLVEPKLLPQVKGSFGELNLAGFSNNRMGVANAMVEGMLSEKQGLSWRLQGSVRRGGSGRTPGYWLANSGLAEHNFSAALGWQKKHRSHELFYSNFNTKLGIFSGAHIGNVTDLLNAISQKEPPDYIRDRPFTYTIDRPYQQVNHQLLKLKNSWWLRDSSRLNVLLSGQLNQRDEFDIRQFASTSMAPQLSLQLFTGAVDISYEKWLKGKHKRTLGANTSFQDNSYRARFFIPNYQAFNASVFAIQKWSLGRWEPELGLRLDHRSMANINGRQGQAFADRSFTSLTGNAGLGYRDALGGRWQLSLSSAWRAPQVNELFANGLHHGAARLEAGDAGLRPERANTLQLGYARQTNRWSGEVNLFAKQIDGFIYLEPVFPPQLTIRGAFPSFRYTQTNAFLYGFDASGRYAFGPHFLAEGQLSVLRARNTTARDWLIQMPADRASLFLRYEGSGGRLFKRPYLRLGGQAVARQTRVPATGNIPMKQPDGTEVMGSDYLPPPPAYWLLSAEAGTGIQVGSQEWQLTLGGTNLANRRYRDYMNAFRYYADELGRNISLKLQIPFRF